jgi:protein LTV1
MGFKNDGYDYSKHMKEMGGGSFIGKNGGARPEYGHHLELPADALPSQGELDRRLEAVTIGTDYMDEDLRAALFNEDDGEEEFEELLDDFITDVSHHEKIS